MTSPLTLYTILETHSNDCIQGPFFLERLYPCTKVEVLKIHGGYFPVNDSDVEDMVAACPALQEILFDGSSSAMTMYGFRRFAESLTCLQTATMPLDASLAIVGDNMSAPTPLPSKLAFLNAVDTSGRSEGAIQVVEFLRRAFPQLKSLELHWSWLWLTYNNSWDEDLDQHAAEIERYFRTRKVHY